jgi:hypothetical protein
MNKFERYKKLICLKFFIKVSKLSKITFVFSFDVDFIEGLSFFKEIERNLTKFNQFDLLFII